MYIMGVNIIEFLDILIYLSFIFVVLIFIYSASREFEKEKR